MRSGLAVSLSFCVLAMSAEQTMHPAPQNGIHNAERNQARAGVPSIAKVPTDQAKTDSQRNKQPPGAQPQKGSLLAAMRDWIFHRSFTDITEFLLLLVTACYLYVTIQIMKASRDANEISRAIGEEAMRLTRESNELTQRNVEIQERAFALQKEAAEIARQPDIRGPRIQTENGPTLGGALRIAGALKNYGGLATRVLASYGFSDLVPNDSFAWIGVTDPLPDANASIASAAHNDPISFHADYEMGAKTNAIMSSHRRLFFYGVILFEDQDGVWYRYRFNTIYQPRTNEWAAGRDLPEQNVQLNAWLRARLGLPSST